MATMPDLRLASESERSPLRYILIAFVILGAVATAIFLLTPRKTAETVVQKVDLFSPHTEFSQLAGSGPHIVGAPKSSEDDLYVVVTLQITDKLHLPIFLTGETATLIFSDNSTMQPSIITQDQFSRLSAIFPKLAAFGKPLNDTDAIQPGTTRQGTIILLFPGLTEAAWHTKKSATLTYTLAHQSPQTVALP